MTDIVFIGGGNMGFALAGGVKKRHPNYRLKVAEPIARQRERFEAKGIATTPTNLAASVDADVVVLAVKPQIIDVVAGELASTLNNQLVISIAAGTPLEKLNGWLDLTLPSSAACRIQPRSSVRGLPACLPIRTSRPSNDCSRNRSCPSVAK